MVDTPYYICQAEMTSPGGFRCISPPWNELVMVNVTSGAVVWRSPLGFIPKPNFQKSWGSYQQFGGVTETLGGLLFVGGTDDNHLWVFDAFTGKELFGFGLPYPAITTPITYRINNIQYVTVHTSNVGTNGAIFGFTIMTSNPRDPSDPRDPPDTSPPSDLKQLMVLALVLCGFLVVLMSFWK